MRIFHSAKKFHQLLTKYCNAPAGDAHGHGRLARGDDDADPRVSAAAHGAATGVHHEADQEPATGDGEEGGGGGEPVRRSALASQSEE